ncbi:MAG TPA: hypothetical protein VN962_24595 [Polyangia bacterium]|nr:hypothetical protein [Polyangia bacterium]
MNILYRLAMPLALLAWVGCATTVQPQIDPAFAARAYTPGRIAVLPPDVFVVLDQFGENDPLQSAALGQQVSAQTLQAISDGLRRRGYDVDLSAAWDGIHGPDGSVLVGADEVGALARSVVAFANSSDAAVTGPVAAPAQIAPELAARVGWATQSGAVLYVNVKGVVTTPGKQAATVLAAVFIVVIVAAIVLALASSKGGGGHATPNAHGGTRAPAVGRAPPAVPMRAPPRAATPAIASRTPGAPPVGGWRGGARPVRPRGGPVYVGGGVNVAVVVPIDEPVYTHDGNVGYEDPMFAGDEVYVSMTLVSTYDGHVLWHARQALDLEANRPEHVSRMVDDFLNTLPPALPPTPTPAPAQAPTAAAVPAPMPAPPAGP